MAIVTAHAAGPMSIRSCGPQICQEWPSLFASGAPFRIKLRARILLKQLYNSQSSNPETVNHRIPMKHLCSPSEASP